MKTWLLIMWLMMGSSATLRAQIKSFRFVHISDTHIGSPNGSAEEDLRRTIQDINQLNDVAFVIVTGDITELGTDEELKLAKQLLDSLKIKYYVIPGNHDSGWSESGGMSFTRIFGYDRFQFDYNGIRFVGCASGPYIRMSDGHIPRDAMLWLDAILKKTPKQQPVIFCNHYPLDESLDNWFNITDRLKENNTILAICGHGHINKSFDFEDIPGVMGRSNLRTKTAAEGYNLVDVRSDSIIYSERRPGVGTLAPWARVKVEQHKYDVTKMFIRPAYNINIHYKQAGTKWRYTSDANVISTPAVTKDLVIFGNQSGEIIALSLKDGKKKWSFKTDGSVFSSPAVQNDRAVVGSGDGYIYCLNIQSGIVNWKIKTGAAVLGSPVIAKDTVFIGCSDHSFMAMSLNGGNTFWKFTGLQGPVMSTPLIYGGMVIFGAWDKNLYALDRNDGKLIWKWNNGSPVINFSPAACIPVARKGVVYIVAPDRYLTAIDAITGATLWRNNEARVRESIGISEDGKWIYGKTMQDSIVAFAANRMAQRPAWYLNAGFGYEHVPSMLIEKDGQVFFGTRNGVVYAIDPRLQTISWAYKIDNSMVNTVRVIDKKHLIAATVDGNVALIEVAN